MTMVVPRLLALLLAIRTLHHLCSAECPDVCLACNMHDPNAPKLYSIQRHDGIGGALSHEILFMAFADMQGWNYGGALGHGHAIAWNHHNEDMQPATRFLLGSSQRTIHPRNSSMFPFTLSEDGIPHLMASPTRSGDSNYTNGVSATTLQQADGAWQNVNSYIPGTPPSQIFAFQVGQENAARNLDGTWVRDDLFAGRKVIVFPGGNFALNGVKSGVLMNLRRPWAFDDLVVDAWTLNAKRASNQPPAGALFRTPFLSKLRQGVECRMAEAPGPDFFLAPTDNAAPAAGSGVAGRAAATALAPANATDGREQPPVVAAAASAHAPPLRVAMHVRRGDVGFSNSHYLNDAYFLKVADLLARTLGARVGDTKSSGGSSSSSGSGGGVSLDVHVFSSTEKWCPKEKELATMEKCEAHGKQLYTNSSFDSFAQRFGAGNVHLDGDTLNHWSHFARADIFVMSRSSFSNAPAFFNKRCVVWVESPWTLLKLPHWITAEDLQRRGFARKKLETCLAGGGGGGGPSTTFDVGGGSGSAGVSDRRPHVRHRHSKAHVAGASTKRPQQ